MGRVISTDPPAGAKVARATAQAMVKSLKERSVALALAADLPALVARLFGVGVTAFLAGWGLTKLVRR